MGNNQDIFVSHRRRNKELKRPQQNVIVLYSKKFIFLHITMNVSSGLLDSL